MSRLILRLYDYNIELRLHDQNIYNYNIITAFFLKNKSYQTYNHIY